MIILAAAIFLLLTDPQALDFTKVPGVPLPGLVLLAAVWLMLAAGILSRLIPNKRVPIGAGKHFACRFSPAPEFSGAVAPETVKQLHRGAAKVVVFWVLLNAAILSALFAAGWLVSGAMIVLALVYSVFDRLFVRFFCPFRAFFMKNDCCTLCRIYSWDYIMICTPLIFSPSLFSLTLFFLALVLLIRWEWVLKKRPHFFVRAANLNLHCNLCAKKNCRKKH